MSEMIERVARVLMKSSFSCSWEQLAPHYQEFYLADARAAIEAMREPTKQMIDAGDNIDDPGSPNDGDFGRVGSAEEHWQAMIAAALKSQPVDA